MKMKSYFDGVCVCVCVISSRSNEGGEVRLDINILLLDDGVVVLYVKGQRQKEYELFENCMRNEVGKVKKFFIMRVF